MVRGGGLEFISDILDFIGRNNSCTVFLGAGREGKIVEVV